MAASSGASFGMPRPLQNLVAGTFRYEVRKSTGNALQVPGYANENLFYFRRIHNSLLKNHPANPPFKMQPEW
jgi:hypothetical protein